MLDPDFSGSAPTISISSGSYVAASENLVFTVTLDFSTSLPVIFNYATLDGTAVAGAQYLARSGTITIPSGEKSVTLSIPTLDDGALNEQKSFSVNLSKLQNSVAGNTNGIGNVVTPSMRLDFTQGSPPMGINVNRSGTATYVNSLGVITLAAPDTARLDYDPITLRPHGLLIENEITNSILHSQDLTDSSYFTFTGLNPSTVAGATELAPDGSANVSLLTVDNSVGNHSISLPMIPWSPDTPATFSIYLKVPPGNQQAIFQASLANSNFSQYVGINGVPNGDLTILCVPFGTVQNAGCSVTDAGNGWRRLSIWGSFDDTSLQLYGNLLQNVSYARSYPGDGTSGFYVWGAQLENELGPSSFIPTVASAVTRNADVVSVASISGYNQSQGTWSFNGDSPSILLSGQFTLFSAIGSLPSGDFYTLGISSSVGNPIVYSAKAQGTDLASSVSAGGSVTSGMQFTSGFAYSANSCQASVDDTLGTQTQITDFPQITSAIIGEDQNGANQFTGHVSKLFYYPVSIDEYALKNLSP